ncbi:PAS domain S-box protein, partial [bacterium]|nr:PAS domain S-box protein [bacterium]
AESNAIALERRRQMADIRTLQLLIKTMDNSQINYIYNGDPVDVQAFKNSIPPLLEFRTQISKTLETEDDQINFNIINRQTDQYIALFSDKIIPARESNDQISLTTLKDESDELISQIDPFIQNMIANYEIKAQSAYQEALAVKDKTMFIVISLSIIVGVIGLFTGFGMASTIGKNTHQIMVATKRLEKSEAALKESERFLNSIIENIPNMVFVKEAPDLRYNMFNRTGEDILGFEPGFVKGKSDFDFFPAELAAFYRAKDLEVLESRQLVDIPEEFVNTKDNEIRLFHTKKIPILDEEGNPRYLLGISEDITERKQAEDKVRQLNAELELRVEQRTAQLESSNKELEAFSYSISHDLRAPLRAINGYAQLIKEDHSQGLSPIAINYFDLIRRNAIIMGQLVDDLLNFSRLGRMGLTKSKIYPVPMIQSIIESMQPELENKKVSFSIKDLPACEADAALLRQVFINLISNAVKFSKDRDESIIEIGYQFSTKDGQPAKQSDQKVTYYVRDNGIGFDMKYYDKLFGVFQRLHTADSYEGTGVGLAIVSRIVNKHGGRIWAEAVPGHGATFFFTLEPD